VVDLLVVCTANVARSPLLEAMLRARLAGTSLTVASAGVDARVGDAAAGGSRTVATARGLDLDGHHSMPLLTVPFGEATVVLAMSRAQRAVVQRHRKPDLAGRTFALRELVRLLERMQDDGLERVTAATAPGSPSRLQALADAAAAFRPVRGRRRLDVPDPIGQDLSAFEELAVELDGAADLLADALLRDG
jgi:protein-tyrosine phosphatase